MFTRFPDSSGVSFRAEIEPIDGLFSKQDEISIYRIVQESTNNIVKHAMATEASLTIKRQGRAVEMRIHDNGRGFTPAVAADVETRGAGFGLTGMAERVRMMRGTCAIESAPGQGTTITIRINTVDGVS